MAQNGAGGTIGGGPPEGSPLASPFGQQIPFDELSRRIGGVTGATQHIRVDDPGFQRPHDPLLQPGAREQTTLVYRDIPLVTVQNSWDPPEVREALRSHMIGIFEGSGQLADSILGDPRVQATLGSRTAGLFGREVRHTPANDSDAAREVCDAWTAHWPRFAALAPMTEIHSYGILMGFGMSQLVWDTSKPVWLPYLRPWHPRYTYYDWTARVYVALSLDGSIPIIPGDGKWVLHAPNGEYRGWIRGAIRALAEPWLLRHYGFRDMARFSEVHGMPIRKAIVPAAASQVDRDRYQTQLSQLGRETTIMVQTGVDGANKYDLELVEAGDTAWEIFPGLIDRCDMDIILALLFQNLTTEVTGGSFAATKSHMDIRQGALQADGEGWASTIRQQVARAFAYLNYGDPELAPITTWDVRPREDAVENGKLFSQFGTAIEVLRRGGVEFNDVEALRKWAADRFGLVGLPDFKITTPVAGGIGK